MLTGEIIKKYIISKDENSVSEMEDRVDEINHRFDIAGKKINE